MWFHKYPFLPPAASLATCLFGGCWLVVVGWCGWARGAFNSLSAHKERRAGSRMDVSLPFYYLPVHRSIPPPHVQLLAGGGCCCWGKRGGTHTLYPLKNEPRHVFGYITYGSTFHSYSSTVRPVHRTIPARAAACWWLLLPVSAAACCWSFLSWSKLAAFVTIGSLPTSCPFAYGMFVNFSPRTHRL
jgi:hypothetical protein